MSDDYLRKNKKMDAFFRTVQKTVQFASKNRIPLLIVAAVLLLGSFGFVFLQTWQSKKELEANKALFELKQKENISLNDYQALLENQSSTKAKDFILLDAFQKSLEESKKEEALSYLNDLQSRMKGESFATLLDLAKVEVLLELDKKEEALNAATTLMLEEKEGIIASLAKLKKAEILMGQSKSEEALEILSELQESEDPSIQREAKLRLLYLKVTQNQKS